jgi:putative phosphoribosyl transferase
MDSHSILPDGDRKRQRPKSGRHDKRHPPLTRHVSVLAGGIALAGDLAIPADATGVVLFAHGSGSSRHSPRNQFVARMIQASGMATLLLDLLTPTEEKMDAVDGRLRFDIALLAKRVVESTRWIAEQPETHNLGIGLFGASTGGAAALAAAAELGPLIQALVSRGGRPDLAGEALPRVASPSLFIVGAYDEEVLRLNRDAYGLLRCEKRLVLVPGATHLFEEPGAIEEVASLADEWFLRYLAPQ